MQQLMIPKLTKINKFIILTMAGTFLVNAICVHLFQFNLGAILALSAEGISRGLIFQIFTYSFLSEGLFAFLFQALVIWFLGPELEQRWGKRIYVSFLIASVWASALIYLFLSFGPLSGSAFVQSLSGSDGIGYALCLAYAIVFSERQFMFMFIFPMKAKYFCMLLGAILFYQALTSGNPSFWAHLAAMGGGFLYLKFKAAKLSKNRNLKDLERRVKKSQLYVVQGDKNKDKDKKGPMIH